MCCCTEITAKYCLAAASVRVSVCLSVYMSAKKLLIRKLETIKDFGDIRP